MKKKKYHMGGADKRIVDGLYSGRVEWSGSANRPQTKEDKMILKILRELDPMDY